MKATLTEKKVYNLTIGGVDLGSFEYADTWNGLSEFRQGSTKIIIGEPTFSSAFDISRFFGAMNGNQENIASDLPVYGMTTDLRDKIKKHGATE